MRIRERITHADPINRHLLNAIHLRRWCDADHIQYRGRKVNDVMKLRSRRLVMLKAFRPGDGKRVPRTAKMRRHLLHPLKRRIQRPCPTHVKMIFTAIGAEIVHVSQ